MIYGIPQVVTLLKKDNVKIFVDRAGNEFTDMDAETLNQLEMASGIARGQDSSLESPQKRFPSNGAAPASSSGPPPTAGSGAESPASRLAAFSSTSPVKPVSPAGRRHTVAVPSKADVDRLPLFPLGPFTPLKTTTSVTPGADANETKEEPESQSNASPSAAASGTVTISVPDANPRPVSSGNNNDPAQAALASMGIGAQFFARPDQSAATTQFSLQLWLQQLLEQNDVLREQLGLPQHKKSRAKTMDLIFSPEPLNVSGINFLIHFAEELSAENMSMQRLIQQGGISATESDNKDRRSSTSPSKFKQRNNEIETQSAAVNRKMSSFPGDLSKRMSMAPTNPDDSPASSTRKQSTLSSTVLPGSQLAAPPIGTPDSPASKRASIAMQPLSKRALGYADDKGTMPTLQEKPREPIESRRFPELPRPQSASRVPSSSRLTVADGDSSIKKSAESPALNQVETSIKHDKLDKRQKYARRMYSMTGVPK